MSDISRSPFRSGITGIGKYFPEREVSNHDLEEMVDTNHEWIVERTGIHNRRWAPKGTGASTLALPACRDALAIAGVDVMELDGLVMATVSPDTVFPSGACVLQEKLGAKKAWAFDLSAACSGWVYAASVADSMIRSGAARRIMVVGVDVMTSIIDPDDRNTIVLFGDGAGATLFERLPEGEEGVLDIEIGADGSGGPFLHMPAGGSVKPASVETVANREHFAVQDGQAVFRAAVEGMADVTLRVLDRIGATGPDVDLFVPHQANLRIIEYARRKAKLAPEKVMITIDRFGNTTAATIPSSLCVAYEEGRLKPGSLVLVSTFGAGFTWGGAALRWRIPNR